MTRATSANEPLLIKKYSNRRLYNTATSNYITLEDLRKLVKDDVAFVVKDAKTDEDLTRVTLTQIILEQESKGYDLLPVNFLRQIICFYDDSLSNAFSQYLTSSMDAFTKNQQQMRDYLKNPIQGFSFDLEDITKQNMQWFENSFKAFAEFASPDKKKD